MRYLHAFAFVVFLGSTHSSAAAGEPVEELGVVLEADSIQQNNVWLVSTGSPRRRVMLPRPLHVDDATWSLGRRTMLFLGAQRSSEPSLLFIYDVVAEELRELGSQQGASKPRWCLDDKSILMIASRQGASLVVVDAVSGRRSPVPWSRPPPPTAQGAALEVAPDGRHLAVILRDKDNDEIWVGKLVGDAREARLVRAIVSTRVAGNLQWLDNTTVGYSLATGRRSMAALTALDVESGNVSTWWSAPPAFGNVDQIRVSPSRDQVAVTQDGPASVVIRVHKRAGGRPRRIATFTGSVTVGELRWLE